MRANRKSQRDGVVKADGSHAQKGAGMTSLANGPIGRKEVGPRSPRVAKRSQNRSENVALAMGAQRLVVVVLCGRPRES